MKHLLSKLLCTIQLHSFPEADSNDNYPVVTCTRCHRAYQVDRKARTMEQKGANE